LDLINGALEKNQKMERKIEVNGRWYSIGDYIEFEEKTWFSFVSTKKYRIDFIGNDSSALISNNDVRKTIIGKVNINN